MATRDYTRIHDALEHRRLFLLREIQYELRNTGDEQFSLLAGPVHDIGDLSVAELLLGVESLVASERTHELLDVERALGRLASGTYGRCAVCGEPIPLARLQVQPTARRCVSCKTKWERRTNTPG